MVLVLKSNGALQFPWLTTKIVISETQVSDNILNNGNNNYEKWKNVLDSKLICPHFINLVENQTQANGHHLLGSRMISSWLEDSSRQSYQVWTEGHLNYYFIASFFSARHEKKRPSPFMAALATNQLAKTKVKWQKHEFCSCFCPFNSCPYSLSYN